MNANERRLNLLLLLQSKQNWKVNQLAEHFGVSRRTIFRDLKTFSEINVPVTWDKDSGYGMMKGYNIPPIMFTPKEISVIMVGLSFVKSQIDATLVDDAAAVDAKIKNILPDKQLVDFMVSIGKKTIVDPYLRFGGKKSKGGDWFTIGNAISKNHKISFRYPARDSSKSTLRKVDPYLLVYYSDHWTLVGFCNDRKEVRSFRLEKMKETEILPETFSGKDIPEQKKLLYRADEGDTIVKVKVSGRVETEFRTTLPAKIESEEKDGDDLVFTFRFDNMDYINEWLFAFHDNVKVLGPDDLKAKRVMKIQSMLRAI